MKKEFLALVLVLLSLQGYAQRIVIHCGHLIDGTSRTAQNEMTLIVEDDRITAVEKGFSIAGTGDQVIDLRAGWRNVGACTTDGVTTQCFTTEAELDAFMAHSGSGIPLLLDAGHFTGAFPGGFAKPFFEFAGQKTFPAISLQQGTTRQDRSPFSDGRADR